MKQSCIKPCAECPFKKDSVPSWLGPWDGAEELHKFVMGEGHLACHLTVDEDDEVSEKTERCVGSILYMNKNFKSCRDATLSAVQKKLKDTDKTNILSSPEFIKHHGKFKK